jgi:hypothetical protein
MEAWKVLLVIGIILIPAAVVAGVVSGSYNFNLLLSFAALLVALGVFFKR